MQHKHSDESKNMTNGPYIISLGDTGRQKILRGILKSGLRGWRDFKPPRLIPSINQGGHFLLT